MILDRLYQAEFGFVYDFRWGQCKFFLHPAILLGFVPLSVSLSIPLA